MSSSNVATVTRYYDETLFDYRWFWATPKALAMHYGWWDETVHSHEESLLRLNAIIAKKLKVQKNDVVLDAGCGMGGSALWMAEHIGCKVDAVSLSSRQIEFAKVQAKRRHLDHLVTFSVADYSKLPVGENHYDASFGIESITNSADKLPFYKEMHRVLKPGGRLLVADGVITKESMNPQEKKLMETAFEGLVVPNFPTLADQLGLMKSAGLGTIGSQDYTKESNPSAIRIYRIAMLFSPVARLLKYAKLITNARFQNAITGRLQWITRKKGLWGHAMWWGKKPA